MPKCIMVTRTDDGILEIPGAAEEEEWRDVWRESSYVERYHDLKGWGKWTALYRTECRGAVLWYFVEGG